MGAPNMDALAEQVVGIPVTRREEKAEGGASEKLDLDTASTPPRRAHRRRRRKIKAKGVLLQANMLRGWFATAIFCGIRDGAPGIFCVSASAEDEDMPAERRKGWSSRRPRSVISARRAKSLSR